MKEAVACLFFQKRGIQIARMVRRSNKKSLLSCTQIEPIRSQLSASNDYYVTIITKRLQQFFLLMIRKMIISNFFLFLIVCLPTNSNERNLLHDHVEFLRIHAYQHF